MTGPKPSYVGLRPDDLKCIEHIQEATGISTVTDVIRFALREAVRELEKRGRPAS